MMSTKMFKHEFAFDPTYGHSESTLRAITPPAAPLGFAEFWQETYAAALSVDPAPTLRPVPSPRKGYEVFEIDYTGVNGFRVGGWLTRPIEEKPVRGVVVGHGYGGREAPELFLPGQPAVVLFPCARGFHRSARPDLPGDAGKHVIHGIAHRDTYMHRYCVMDLFSAVSALLSLHPEMAGRVDYMGTSFGGGMGGLMLPWEKRVRRGYLGVPSFGHHPIRLTIPCVGSGESVRQTYLKNPAIAETLRYFDSAIASTFSRTPTMVGCALFDPAVPPPGQWAVYNALPCEKHVFIHQAEHFAWDGQPAEFRRLFREQECWFCS